MHSVVLCTFAVLFLSFDELVQGFREFFEATRLDIERCKDFCCNQQNERVVKFFRIFLLTKYLIEDTWTYLYRTQVIFMQISLINWLNEFRQRQKPASEGKFVAIRLENVTTELFIIVTGAKLSCCSKEF